MASNKIKARCKRVRIDGQNNIFNVDNLPPGALIYYILPKSKTTHAKYREAVWDAIERRINL